MPRSLPTSLLMSIAGRHAETRIVEAVRAAGFEDLTIAQARLMAGIQDGGSRISTLAERAQITKQTATVLVDRLEAAGYVMRASDPSDGRVRLVRFTEQALAMIPAARAEEARIEREWAAHLGDRDFAALTKALERLRALVDPEDPRLHSVT
ncbi:MarR family winged helix-turn-helix transcriptional regulator [Gordonia hydrophobica]|uniref:MarR family transcriptional regulator n=1 Tax=Gordonia hydrophobica TaxID=40516 RepID=A0ABZ2U1Q3_9ACTN|nr:MarR family transcriptional regulator [Gordonia hydrophobica]MBM7367648.1 DNA-binding MarR family transcriptional regulator [Gordonia hydrophobica]